MPLVVSQAEYSGTCSASERPRVADGALRRTAVVAEGRYPGREIMVGGCGLCSFVSPQANVAANSRAACWWLCPQLARARQMLRQQMQQCKAREAREGAGCVAVLSAGRRGQVERVT